MTQQELFEYDADALEKLSDAALLEWAAPFLKATRPPIAVTEKTIRNDQVSTVSKKDERAKNMQKVLELAKALGHDLGKTK